MSRVFSNEMNWSTYQDRQMAVLVSLERSFNSSLNMSKAIKDSLTNVQSAMTSMIQSANSLASFVNNLSSSSRSGGKKMSNARATREALDQMKRNLEEAHRLEMQNAHDIHEQNMSYLEEQVRIAREELEASRENQKTQREILEAQKTATNYFWQQTQQHMSKLGKIADNYSEASNNMIKITGAPGSQVMSSRNIIVKDIIGELNKETNGFYSPLDSYQKIVSIANDANVGSLSALKELTRPILLADESMDANIGELATIFNRFYTRYTFSSAEMENIVNEIRGNTAGNSATAEATVKNIAQLQNWIALYSKGDTEKIEAMMESVSRYTSHLESMGVNTGTLTGYMESILWGDANLDASGLVKILSAAGSSTLEAQQLLRNDTEGFAKVSQLLYTGIERLVNQYGGIDNLVMGATWDNAKIDRELLDLYTAMQSSNWTSQSEFLDTVSGAQSAVEAVEDKYVSATDRANHLLENIALSAANIQEKMDSTFGFGIGATEVAGTIVMIRGILDAIDIFRRAGGGTTTTSTSTIGSRILGSARSIGTNSALRGAVTTPNSMQGAAQGLGKVAGLGGGLGGAAMLAGGVAAGGALAWDGISGLTKEDSDALSKSLSGVEAAGGAVGAGALIALGVSNPIGWIALAIGGLALFSKKWYEAATTFGAAEVVEKAYEQAAQGVRDRANENENLLLRIKSDLMFEEDLNRARNNLINSGLLTERDVEKARKANKEGLEALTDTYLKANEKWSAETQTELNNKMLDDMAYAKKLHGNLDTQLFLQGVDRSGFASNPELLTSTEKMMYSLYRDLQSRNSNGEKFDAPTQKIYRKMSRAFKDGELSAQEAHNITRAGFFNTAFRNAKFSPEALVQALQIMAVTNDTGKSFYDKVTKGLGNYSGDTSYDTNLDPGYAVGTNYIDHDQIALLHEGESVVPKAYNPAANMTELEALREQSRSQRSQESSETREYLQSFVSTLNEIKEFLSYWREDNIKRETMNSAKNQYSAVSRFVAGYMSTE